MAFWFLLKSNRALIVVFSFWRQCSSLHPNPAIDIMMQALLLNGSSQPSLPSSQSFISHRLSRRLSMPPAMTPSLSSAYTSPQLSQAYI
ncbi:hypothetical protein SDJN03_13214, partial [Cucurbita argyrosperma subsp. sororia]